MKIKQELSRRIVPFWLVSSAIISVAAGQVPAPASQVAATNPSSNQTVPTAPTQSALSQPTPEAKQLDQLVTQFQTEHAATDAQIKQLNSQLTDVTGKLSKATQTTDQVTQLIARIDAIEKLQKAQDAQNITTLAKRYQGGYALISLMDLNAARLQLAFQLSSSVNQFQILTNPVNNPAFTSALGALKQSQINDNGGLSLPAALMANPYVSLAMSVVTVFTSKDKAEKKNPTLETLACLVNLSTATGSDLASIQADLQTLIDKTTQFDNASQKLFATYTQAVGYSEGIEKYRQALNAQFPDPLQPLVVKAFGTNGTATVDQGPNLIRAQILRAQDHLAKYDSLIQDTQDFFLKFSKILGKDQALFEGATCAPQAQKQFQALKLSVDQLEPQFEKGEWSFSGSARAVLNGTVAQ